MADVDEHVVNRIVEAARAVAASTEQVPAPGSAEPLQDAVSDASPDDRSAAAQELAGDEDRAALDALHEALRALDIEPTLEPTDESGRGAPAHRHANGGS